MYDNMYHENSINDNTISGLKRILLQKFALIEHCMCSHCGILFHIVIIISIILKQCYKRFTRCVYKIIIVEKYRSITVSQHVKREIYTQ